MNIKTISVRQPWANLIVWGLKTIEIRTWSTQYRGALLIHASKTADEIGIRRFPMDNQSLGALIGEVELLDVKPFTAEMWSELADCHLDIGPYVPGLFAWFIANPVPFERPIPYSGMPGLFDVDLAASLQEANTL